MYSRYKLFNLIYKKKLKKSVELPGFEPGTSHMRSERSTAELQPQFYEIFNLASEHIAEPLSHWHISM